MSNTLVGDLYLGHGSTWKSCVYSLLHGHVRVHQEEQATGSVVKVNLLQRWAGVSGLWKLFSSRRSLSLYACKLFSLVNNAKY